MTTATGSFRERALAAHRAKRDDEAERARRYEENRKQQLREGAARRIVDLGIAEQSTAAEWTIAPRENGFYRARAELGGVTFEAGYAAYDDGVWVSVRSIDGQPNPLSHVQLRSLEHLGEILAEHARCST